MRILLVGGAGFLGVNAAISLMKYGHEVFIMDRNCVHVRAKEVLAGVSGLYEGDFSDFHEVFSLVDRLSIDCLINFASTLIPSSDFDAFSAEIISGSVPMFRLINGLADRGVKYVFISSGGTIYGTNRSERIHEQEKRQPINLYGLSKLIFEEYIEYAGRSCGLDYLVVRPSNPYGQHQNPYKKQGLVAVAMDRVRRGEAVEVWGDGSVVRDYIYIDDMVDALSRLIGAGKWKQVFNIGTGVGYSIREVLDVIQKVTEWTPVVSYTSGRNVDTDRMVLDVSKLESVIDFKPRSLETGVMDYYKSIVSGHE